MVGSTFPTTTQNQNLVSHQDGFGNKRTETTRPSQLDDDNDRVQQKSENVAHGQNRIKLKKPKNSCHLRTSPSTGCAGRFRAAASEVPGSRLRCKPRIWSFTVWAMPIVWRPGVTVAWRAGSTVSMPAARLPVKACFISNPMLRTWPSCT